MPLVAAGAGTVLEINTKRDITINGIDPDDRSGFSVASGDIDNDGVDDLIISSPERDPGGRTSAGETYVVFGPLSAGTLELATAADITINGIDAFDGAGIGVGSGDINNDGVDDLIIGAPGGSGGGGKEGETYVLFGPLSAGTLELSTAADITLNGIDIGDESGRNVGTGDIDNDGVDDLIIGAFFADPGGRTSAGETYVVFGPLSAGTLELATAADITVNGIDAGDDSGGGVGSGDINNDGVDDLIIGALLADPGGRTDAGESYVLFGPLSAGTLELSTAADITLNGIGAGDFSGGGVGSGDINGDGVGDLVIGASLADPGGRTDAGESYVLFGPLSAGTLELSTAADITLNGIDTGDKSGCNLSSGDIDNDGLDDLIIGARFADPGGRTDAGVTYVLFGEPPPTPTPIPGVTGWGLIGMAGLMVVILLWQMRRTVGRRAA